MARPASRSARSRLVRPALALGPLLAPALTLAFAGSSLTYEVPVDLQHGTYWWHSHSSVAYQDGLRGAFPLSNPSSSERKSAAC